jgi:hypothetical protein
VEKEHDLFISILKLLEDIGALNDLLLIGGWCPLIYRERFGNPVEISVRRTADLDFLIINASRIKKEIDIPGALKELGFDEKISRTDGYVKYVHPDLEIEFLIAEKGKGSDKPYAVEKLHINAQGLRFLEMLLNSPVRMNYRGVNVLVPDPSAYVLHKFIISERRKNDLKKMKDLTTAKELGEYLLQDSEYGKRLKSVYLSLPEKWRKNLDDIIKTNSAVIYQFIKSSS